MCFLGVRSSTIIFCLDICKTGRRMAGQKLCSKCKTVKSMNAFHNRYDGVQCWCRECTRDYRKQRKPEAAIAPKSHLYVMSYKGVPPGIYKIGQSSNVDQRIQTLEQSNLVRIVVVAVFWDRGDLESYVHDSLCAYRIKGYRAREWYNCPLDTVLGAIAAAHAWQPRPVDVHQPLMKTLDSYFDRESDPPLKE